MKFGQGSPRRVSSREKRAQDKVVGRDMPRTGGNRLKKILQRRGDVLGRLERSRVGKM